MSRYKILSQVLEDIAVDPEDLMTLSEAAEILGWSLPNMNLRLLRGQFTVIIDTHEPNPQRHKRLLGKEVEEASERKYPTDVG